MLLPRGSKILRARPLATLNQRAPQQDERRCEKRYQPTGKRSHSPCESEAPVCTKQDTYFASSTLIAKAGLTRIERNCSSRPLSLHSERLLQASASYEKRTVQEHPGNPHGSTKRAATDLHHGCPLKLAQLSKHSTLQGCKTREPITAECPICKRLHTEDVRMTAAPRKLGQVKPESCRKASHPKKHWGGLATPR
jgi:hypothetical protein